MEILQTIRLDTGLQNFIVTVYTAVWPACMEEFTQSKSGNAANLPKGRYLFRGRYPFNLSELFGACRSG